VAALALLAATGCAGPTAPGSVTGPSASNITAVSSPAAATILELTNVERTRAGLAPLRADTRLMDAAQLQSAQMAEQGRLDHELPSAPYPKPADRLAAAGYVWQAYAENIATGQPSAAAVVDAWMQSSGHRANILNPNLTELGAAAATDASGRPYYTQVFGRPR
jgi:uncharacterized protein YkwD